MRRGDGGNGWWAFQRVVTVKKERIISGWPGGTVGGVKFGSGGVMHRDQRMLKPTGETINLTH